MDTAVGLVQAYLRINGFFTVTEYPIIARSQAGGRMLTDMDILAVRFPGAQRWIPDAERQGEALPIDPRLADDDESMFMIIGEVKEGRPASMTWLIRNRSWKRRSAVSAAARETFPERSVPCCR